MTHQTFITAFTAKYDSSWGCSFKTRTVCRMFRDHFLETLLCTALQTRSSLCPQHRLLHPELFLLYFICKLWRQAYCSEHVHVDVIKRVKRCALMIFAYIWVSSLVNITQCMQSETSFRCWKQKTNLTSLAIIISLLMHSTCFGH